MHRKIIILGKMLLCAVEDLYKIIEKDYNPKIHVIKFLMPSCFVNK
jgi:hypothetical protein